MSQIQATLRNAGLNTKFIDTAFLKVQGSVPPKMEERRAPVGASEYDLQLEPIPPEESKLAAPPSAQVFTDRRAVSRGAVSVRVEQSSAPAASVELDLAPLKTGSRRIENEEIYDPLLQRTVRFEQRASQPSLEPEETLPESPVRRVLPRTLTVTRDARPDTSPRETVRFFGMQLGPYPVRSVFWVKTAVLLLAVYLAFALPFNQSRERFSIIDATPLTVIPPQ